MRQLPSADYEFMSAFGEIVIEGVVGLIKALTGTVEDAVDGSPDAKKALKKAKLKAGKKEKASSTPQDNESISRDELCAAHNGRVLPHIKGATDRNKNPAAAMRFDWYEKKGFLAECLQQREERISGKTED